jgi:hypothetical protein
MVSVSDKVLTQEAVMVAVVVVKTAPVLMPNVLVVCPAATITAVGTVAFALLLLSVTVAPPGGAGPSSVTRPTVGRPPMMLPGSNSNELSDAAITSNSAVRVLPYFAETVTSVVEVTDAVEISKDPVVEPCAMLIDGGTEAPSPSTSM